MIFLETERSLFRTHEASDETDFVNMHIDPEDSPQCAPRQPRSRQLNALPVIAIA